MEVADELLGQELGDYRIDRVLGRGGMGVVYEAEDLALQRPVALKVLLPGLVHDSTATARFQREIEAAVAHEHPNIVPVYAAGFERPYFYIAMRKVPGRDLAAVVAQEGPIAEHRALTLVGQLANALYTVHERGMIHRDVKPHNVLLWTGGVGDEHALLTDFGIAKALDDTRGITGIGAPGTPAYMAPELWRGAPASPASDQFALACLLVELLTGEPPSRGLVSGDDQDVVSAQPVDLVALSEVGATDGVVELVRRALAASPSERWPDLKSFASAMRGADEAFRLADSMTVALAGPEETRVRLLAAEKRVSDEFISQVVDVDPTLVLRERRRLAREALLGTPQAEPGRGS